VEAGETFGSNPERKRKTEGVLERKGRSSLLPKLRRAKIRRGRGKDGNMRELKEITKGKNWVETTHASGKEE